ncbi:hypothetical protein HYALB_00009916 [Hymenoscyphus albidus]|uniref:Secreted protein n=1 Tax=Hymenoscyphus albidus TaxID=595503 RepID=A0A9N9LV56_9HELO|nr:hypothetical protein HYALB_00009916 [Hymenoscyphus albidus]
MQIQNLLVLVTLTTSVYGAGYGVAWCQGEKGVPLNLATEQVCKDLIGNGCTGCKVVRIDHFVTPVANFKIEGHDSGNSIAPQKLRKHIILAYQYK